MMLERNENLLDFDTCKILYQHSFMHLIKLYGPTESSIYIKQYYKISLQIFKS